MTARPRMLPTLAAIDVGMLIALMFGVEPAAAAATPDVPFKAVYSGTFTPTSTGFDVVGAGRATSLGASRNRGTVVMLAQPNPACPTTGFVVTNDETLIAANGDQLTLSILDEPCPVAGEPGIYDGVSTYHIAGGTGRFSAAHGEGYFDGRGDFTDPNHLTFAYTFAGTIGAPGGR